MTHIILRRQAIDLRKKGRSYNQIKSELGVSKSTLSGWLKHYPLSEEQLLVLRDDESRIEKYRQTMKTKRELRDLNYLTEARSTLLPLTQRELFLAGLFLYWGEGGKTERGLVSISNTDPGVLKFSLAWLMYALDVPKENIKVLLHLYKDMPVYDSIEFWSNILHIPASQFTKPYIKKSSKADLDHKGFGHGTCMLRVCSTVLKEKFLMSIKAMADYYGQDSKAMI